MITSQIPLNVAAIAEQRVIFHHLNWDRYQQIQQALGEHRSARLIYDQGTLEITMPLEEHEFLVRMIERVILCLVFETDGKIKTMGSTTLDFPNLNRAAEPDNAYYLQNQPAVQGHQVDLTQDPPPDLVVEVDLTHSDINKLDLYAAMGILEFWRFNGQEWSIYQLGPTGYQAVEISPTFPQFPKTKLMEFLLDAQQDEMMAERKLRQWIRAELC